MMRKNIFFICVLLGLIRISSAQNSSSSTYAEFIDEKDLTNLMYTIASPNMEGRKTGRKGQKLTASLIANRFRKLGIQSPASYPDFYQKFNLVRSSPYRSSISINGQKLQSGIEYLFEGELDMSEARTLPLEYVGYGNSETLERLNLKGKVVAVIYQAEKNFDLKRKIKKLGAKMVILLFKDLDVAAYQNKSTAREKGAYIRTTDKKASQYGNFILDLERFEQVYGKPLSEFTANDKGEKVTQGNDWEFSYFVERKKETISTENVLGIIEGSTRKDEVIILSAHYDHEGIKDDQIFAGADDNASGTVALLELAEAFQKAKDEGHGPKRTILFIAFSAEEDGLLGSYHYINHPVFPIRQHQVNLNMDMIGRVAPEYADYEDYIYILGTNRHPSLKALHDSINTRHTKLDLDYSLDIPEKLYRQSDQWAFAQKGIPALGYFNGVHDDYHTAGDTPDKINFSILRKRALLVFHATWNLANFEGDLVIDP